MSSLSATGILIGTWMLEFLTEISTEEQPSHDEEQSFYNFEMTEHKISSHLTILTPENIDVAKKGRCLCIGGLYYDPDVRGHFKWKDGQLISKKGNIIHPL